MNNFFNVLEFISNFLIKALNAFKFKSPILFGLVATIIIWLLAQLQGGVIIIPEIPVVTSILNVFGVVNMNNFVTGILILVLTGIAPHTEKKVEELEK